MPISNEQALWVARFTGGRAGLDSLGLEEQLQVALANEETEARSLRTLHLEQMRRDVDAIKDEIREAYHADIELQSGEAMKMIDADQTEAFDWWEDIGKVNMEQLLADKRDQRMSEAKVKLTMIEQRMQAVRFTWSRIEAEAIVRNDTKPLFDGPTLTKELYTPLVRELVLPETFVENEFSRVQQMIDASNDIYIKELENVSKNAERDERVALATATIDAVAEIAAAGVDIQNVRGVVDDEKTKLVQNYITLTKDLLDTGLDLTVKFSDNEEGKGMRLALASMSKSAGFAVAQITGSEAIGKYVTAAMNATSHIGEVATAIKEKASADEIIEKLQECIADGFELAGVRAESTDNDELSRKLAEAKVATTAAIKALLAAQKNEILKACQSGEWGKVRTVLATAVAQGARTGFAEKFPEKIEDTEEGADEIADAFSEAAEALAEEGEETAEAEVEAETLEKAQAEQVLAEEQRNFADAVELLGQREALDEGELKKISELLAKLKRDAAIMKSASSIGAQGFEVAKEFLAPLAIGGTLVKFTTNLAAAIERGRAMRKWMESRGEALTAVSPYYTSIQNFVNSQKEQFEHKTIIAALQLLQAAAQITATAGTGTPVQAIATIIDKGLSMGETLTELTFKYHQQRELEVAWVITKRALDNPDNRKANLLARRQNPTLSKYSIAYGAIEAKDIVAISAMNRIGLSRETLAQEDAKVESVKEYLELLYADDIQVKRQYRKQTGWAADFPAPALQPRTWMFSLQIAIDKKELNSGQDDGVNRNLTRVSQSLDAVDAAASRNEVTDAMVELAMSHLRDLRSALHAFAPENAEGEPVAELLTLRDQYLDLVSERAGELSVMETLVVEPS